MTRQTQASHEKDADNDTDVGDLRAEAAARIVAAWISNPHNEIVADDVPDVAQEIAAALAATSPEQIDETCTCMECGRTLKTLRLHLRTAHGLSPHAYRAKWRIGPREGIESVDTARRRAAAARSADFGKRKAR